MRLSKSRGLAAVVLGVAASVLVACGQTNGLLSSNQGVSLSDQLDRVSNAVANTDCRGARQAAGRLELDARRVSPTVAAKLRTALEQGAATVAQKAERACAQTTTTQTVPTTTTVIPTATTPTVTTQSTPTTTTSTQTTPTTTTPTQTTPTTTTPTVPTSPTTTPAAPPSGGGGIGPGGGGTGTLKRR